MEEALRRESHGAASLTTAFVECDETAFDSTLKKAFREIHHEKDSRRTYGVQSAALLTSPYYHRCSYLPTEPASGYKSYEENEEGRYVSKAADDRLRAVTTEEKVGLDKSLLEEMGLDSDRYRLPYKLDDLFKSTEGGYMAFIAADGNSIGQMLEVIDNAELYKTFSQEMYDLTIEAIAQAAKRAGVTERGKSIFRKRHERERLYAPLIPVIVAGDDMSIIVRAEDALGFTQHLCEEFAKLSSKKAAIQKVIKRFCNNTDYQVAARRLFPDCFLKIENGDEGKYQPKPEGDKAWKEQCLTLSAGVAIAKRKFPISVYRRLAGELRDEAKLALTANPESVRQGGVIDFSVITTATAQSLETLRKHYSADEKTRLTMRPYAVEDFANMKRLALALKELPRSKRKYLYTELFSGEDVGQTAYQFVLERSVEDIRKEIRAAAGNIRNDFRHGAFSSSLKHREERETPLIDALEIAELLGKEQ